MAHYRIRVMRDGLEIEVDSSDKEYTDAKFNELVSRMERQTSPSSGPKPTGAVATPTPDKPVSMVEYVRALSPKSGPQFVVAVGHYLEKHGGMTDGFKTRDIADGFTNTRYKHSNPPEAVRQAKSQGLLMDGRRAGTLLVTSTGEDWIKVQLSRDSAD